MKVLGRVLIAILATTTFAGCANMNAQQKNTAIGAAIGGVAGSVLTGGSAVINLVRPALAQATGLHVALAPDNAYCVANGLQKALLH